MFTPTESIVAQSSLVHTDSEELALPTQDFESVESQPVTPMVNKTGFRRIARRSALQCLYSKSLAPRSSRPQTATEVSAAAAPSLLQLNEEFSAFLQHFEVPVRSRGFATKLVAGVLLNQIEIDTLLTKYAHNWRLDRMNVIDRMILELATYELLYLPETPTTVVINEAVELAKDFGGPESPGFINGILDAMRKQLPTAKLA